ncbi:hypothetical protein TBLA_0D03890 [Henningerozyma blattae CBS 6284]|uniref:Enolase-phosphatase E1 n=1 Tax=Henningerozyma blattae (strain ATCC 34711 / CBS 6284 / DSM 70876 / NBRC 10599 / NRRL Y-10934 / UCD 77-7) TaxID=1071380 RepID=I2H3D6_HENB6|nr:hypothetical protein TBLA_0D03890 [Tetrapisispora blattae CBS 6284]CCH60888.1 hypothetical protein TBLA_0D03890 [Tetrapisispora blattae CBS 6284]
MQQEVKAYLLDIEGTVCPISFVHKQLFPYFSSRLGHVIATHFGTGDEIDAVLQQFPAVESATVLQDYIADLVARDVKDATLKSLQGIVWAEGYSSGEIESPVYSDAIRLIKETRVPVYIYSSGSVAAQKQMFGHVKEAGDLCPQLRGYFDIPSAGPKMEASSYKKIVAELGVEAKSVLFLSDNPRELHAARAAGLATGLALRPGNGPVSAADQAEFTGYTDFSELK